MARGPKKHLKRLCAPKNWLLDKLGGVFAPRPSPGPHKARECLPLILIVRNRLKYALTGTECTKILMARAIKIDSKVRTDKKYPVGFMDVISIDKTNDFFRLLYDVKGRFVLHRITKDEASYKILAVRNRAIGPKQIPYITTHDGRTIRYPDPSIRKHDSVRFDLKKGKIIDYIKFEPGSLAMVTAGSNVGRVGVIVSREKHMGSIDIVNLRDSLGHTFATRITSCCVIGKTTQPYISLPKGKGIRLTPAEERDKRLAAKRQGVA